MSISAIICADWGKARNKRAAYVADVAARSIRRLHAAPTFAGLLADAQARTGSVVLGFDVPLGVPTSLLTGKHGAFSEVSFIDLLDARGHQPRAPRTRLIGATASTSSAVPSAKSRPLSQARPCPITGCMHIFKSRGSVFTFDDDLTVVDEHLGLDFIYGKMMERLGFPGWETADDALFHLATDIRIELANTPRKQRRVTARETKPASQKAAKKAKPKPVAARPAKKTKNKRRSN